MKCGSVINSLWEWGQCIKVPKSLSLTVKMVQLSPVVNRVIRLWHHSVDKRPHHFSNRHLYYSRRRFCQNAEMCFLLKCFVWFVDICSRLPLECLLVVGWCTNRSLISFIISDDETCISCYFCCVVYNSGGLFALSWLLMIKKKAATSFCDRIYFQFGNKTAKVTSCDDFKDH